MSRYWDPGVWSGVTLAINLHFREAVHAAIADAIAAGAELVQRGTERDWGGYSAYVADPKGARWSSPGLRISIRTPAGV